MLTKILAHIFHDPHTLFALFGIGVALTPEAIETATLYVKLYSVVVGALIVTITGIHKIIVYKKGK